MTRHHRIHRIEEALTKMRTDMRSTHMVRHGDQFFEEPAYVLGPKEIALLIDRLQVFLNAPSRIVEQRSVVQSASRQGD